MSKNKLRLNAHDSALVFRADGTLEGFIAHAANREAVRTASTASVLYWAAMRPEWITRLTEAMAAADDAPAAAPH